MSSVLVFYLGTKTLSPLRVSTVSTRAGDGSSSFFEKFSAWIRSFRPSPLCPKNRHFLASLPTSTVSQPCFLHIAPTLEHRPASLSLVTLSFYDRPAEFTRSVSYEAIRSLEKPTVPDRGRFQIFSSLRKPQLLLEPVFLCLLGGALSHARGITSSKANLFFSRSSEVVCWFVNTLIRSTIAFVSLDHLYFFSSCYEPPLL